MSPLDSTDSPKAGGLSSFNVYTVLLGISLLCLLAAITLLFLEGNRLKTEKENATKITVPATPSADALPEAEDPPPADVPEALPPDPSGAPPAAAPTQ